MYLQTNSITLKSTPFEERSKILKVLTKDFGIISIIVKNLNSKNSNLLNFCSPFTLAEINIRKSKSEIYTLKDVTIKDLNLYLRKDLKYITSASLIIKSILDSHFPQNQSFKAYMLLKTYLKNIHINPDAIYLSFLLKLLSIEGLIDIKTNCTICNQQSTIIENGQSFCTNHKNKFSYNFEQQEFETLFVLTHTKSFSLLKNLEISKNLKEKLKSVFLELI